MAPQPNLGTLLIRRLALVATLTPLVIGIVAVAAVHRGASLEKTALAASLVHAAVFIAAVVSAGAAVRARQTEAERVANDLAKNHEHYVHAVEGSTDGLWDWDVAANTVYFSPRYKTMLGYAESELPNDFETWKGLIHPDDYARAMKTVDDYHDGRIPIYELEHRLKTKDGAYRWILARGAVLRDADGVVRRMSGSHTDIDDRKRAEASQRENEQRFRQLAENIREVFWLSDLAKNEMIYISPGYELVWGRSCASLYGSPRTWLEAIHPEDRERVLAAATTKQARGDYDETYRIIRPDGAVRRIRDRAFPVRDDNGVVYRIAGVAEDVTDRILLEEQLRSARDAALASAQAKSEFLANVSHELRTPLNAIQGVCELMSRQPLPEPHATRAALAQDAVQVLTAIIDDLLDVAKMEAGRMTLDPQPANVKRLLDDSAAFFREPARRKGLDLRLELSPLLPDAVRVDPLRLRQIVSNLLANAIKFTEQGTVRLAASSRPAGDGAALIRITVSDTGIGISPEARANLFQPFAQADASTTRRYGGTGLGLAICRRLVELMGGRIGADSRPGEGSEFWLEIAAPVESAAPAPAGAPEAPRTSAGARVLVVEDNHANRQITSEMLSLLGAVTGIAENGKAALEALAREPWDLVLMDCSMPVMDGYEATAELRRREDPGARTPVVAMTAHALQGDREKCLAAGMDDYLTKPLRLNDLAGALSRWTAPVDAKTLARASTLAAAASPRWRADYLEDAGRLVAAMRRAAADGRTDELKRAAHTLKGSSAALGARRLAAVCARIESSGAGDALLDLAAAELEAVSNALAAYPIIG